MKKKTYMHPSVKVIHLEATAILANSGEPRSLGLFDEEVTNPDEETHSGYQW